jgi:hypothetical protein
MKECVNTYKKISFFESFHYIGLFTKLSQLLNHIELFFDLTFIIFKFNGLVLGEVSLLMFSSGYIFNLSKFFPGSSLENLWSARVEASGYFGSFSFNVAVLINYLLVLEVDFDC